MASFTLLSQSQKNYVGPHGLKSPTSACQLMTYVLPILVQLSQGMDKWVDEFAKEHQQQGVDDQWVDEFSKLHVEDWAEEFGQKVSEGDLGESSADNWADAYDK